MTHPSPLPIEIVAEDGCALRGQVWPGGDDWIVLLHDVDVDGERDLDTWLTLLPALQTPGATVCAVDLRGHGASDGEWTASTAISDCASLIRYVRANRPQSVALIAAGQSAVAAIEAAEREPVDGIVVLSARAVATGEMPLPRGGGVAKLFVVGANDRAAREMTARLQRASIGWTLVATVPTSEQGTDLLRGDWAGHITEQITGFMRERRYLARADNFGERGKG